MDHAKVGDARKMGVYSVLVKTGFHVSRNVVLVENGSRKMNIWKIRGGRTFVFK